MAEGADFLRFLVFNYEIEVSQVSIDSPKKILIFDDEQIVGDIACQMLEYFKCESVHVTNAESAIEAYRIEFMKGQTFDAVIMDLNVPGGHGGKEAVQDVLGIDPNAKVFVSSGDSLDPAMVKPQNYGFVGVICKPFDLATIEAFVNQILE